MILLNRTELFERLVSNVVEVRFTKVTGEPRVMRCTLQPSFLAGEDIEDSTDSSAPLDHGRMNVWDVEADDWRSFRIESVTSVLTPAP